MLLKTAGCGGFDQTMGERVQFAAVDVETANPDYTSVCQVGVALFGRDGLERTWSTLVDPEDYFDSMNVSIHGITPEMVAGQPRIVEVFPALRDLLEGGIVAHHMPFDRTALRRVTERHSLAPLRAKWVDTASVVRRTWLDRSRVGYGLKDVADSLGIGFSHHDALEDAIACGRVFMAAVSASGTSVEDWVLKAQQPIGGRTYSESVEREGAAEGPLSGESLVFTGSLQVPRREAADLAASAGAQVSNSVTRRTTLLVVGVQNIRKVGEDGKSTKHKKAEALIRDGHPITIMSEEDFIALVSYVPDDWGV